MRPELAHFFICPWSAMTSLFLRHKLNRSPEVEKAPHLDAGGQARGTPARFEACYNATVVCDNTPHGRDVN